MMGTVLIYDKKTGKGILEDSKGDVYLFDDTCVAGGHVPETGSQVYFEFTKTSQVMSRSTYVIRTLPHFRWSAS